jgi:hypothetical protein
MHSLFDNKDKTDSISIATKIGITQSSLMCIDILAKYLCSSNSNNAEWLDKLSAILNDMVTLSATVKKMISSIKDESNKDELYKLLGSIYLCCSTLCGGMKARALAQLPVRLYYIIKIVIFFETHCLCVLSLSFLLEYN